MVAEGAETEVLLLLHPSGNLGSVSPSAPRAVLSKARKNGAKVEKAFFLYVVSGGD